MSKIVSSRRSFLIGFSALIAAPAIVRASNIMPVKQMLILPPRLDDVTFRIEGWARSSPEYLRYYTAKAEIFGKWERSSWNGKAVMPDANERWERMKRRELIYRNHEWDGNPIT